MIKGFILLVVSVGQVTKSICLEVQRLISAISENHRNTPEAIRLQSTDHWEFIIIFKSIMNLFLKTVSVSVGFGEL